MIKIHVIIGSTRKGRFGDKPARWIVNELKKRKEIEVELVDLRDWQLPFFDEAVSPMANKGVYEHALAAKWAKKVGSADGYVLVTPEYNHGYSAVLKNALDYVYHEWNKKPVAFVGYGVSGAVRAVEQLRQVVLQLQMVSVSAAVHINSYWTLLDDAGNLKTESLQSSADAMISELVVWAHDLKIIRSTK